MPRPQTRKSHPEAPSVSRGDPQAATNSRNFARRRNDTDPSAVEHGDGELYDHRLRRPMSRMAGPSALGKSSLPVVNGAVTEHDLRLARYLPGLTDGDAQRQPAGLEPHRWSSSRSNRSRLFATITVVPVPTLYDHRLGTGPPQLWRFRGAGSNRLRFPVVSGHRASVAPQLRCR